MGYGLVVWFPLWDAAFNIAAVNTGLLLMICLKCLVEVSLNRVDPAVIVRVRMLLELIFIRNGLFYLNMPDFDIQFLISQLCIM